MRFGKNRGQKIQTDILGEAHNHLLRVQGLTQVEPLLCQHRLAGAQGDLHRVSDTRDRHGKGKALTRARRQFDRTGKRGSMEVTTRLTPQPGPHPQRPHDGHASVVHLYGDHIPLAQTQGALEPQARLHGDLG